MAQELIVTKLQPNMAYQIVLEFSEELGSVDGTAAHPCEHFVLAVKSWDSEKVCGHWSNIQDLSSMPSSIVIDAEPVPSTLTVTHRNAKRDI